MKKRVAALLTGALLGIVCMTGCGSSDATAESAATETEAAVQETASTEAETEAVTEETQETESAETTDGKAAILAVSFGTSYNDSRDVTIGAVEGAIADAFPEYEVRRAFTSQIIIDILAERDGLEIDNVEQALDRAVADGVTTLVVQPTHLMNGFEYTDLVDELKNYEDKFDQIAVAEPLLMSDADFDAVVKAITEKTASYDDGETAICFMGHGTEAQSNEVYGKLQSKLAEAGYENYYIGTVEAEPSLDTVMAALEEKGSYKKVVLEPMMLVAGDHANNDMAGDEEDSWKMVLTEAGYEVECIVEGLGQIPGVQAVYVEHTQAAIDSLTK